MKRLGLLIDREIAALCENEPRMIEPFCSKQIGRPSYGLSSVGYDLRLGFRFLVPKKEVAQIIDPLAAPAGIWEEVRIPEGAAFILPPHSTVLSETVEWLRMPEDVVALILGKSTYARCGLLVNATPVEPSWEGRLALLLSNLSPFPLKLYPGLGIAQAIFFRIPRPKRTYTEKETGGHYQGQEGITPAF